MALASLNSYMLTNELINSISDYYTSINRVLPEKKNCTNDISKNIKKPEFFYPIENDTFFWIFYVLKEGIDAYNFMKRSYQIEKTEKFEIISYINTNKKMLKDQKSMKSLNTGVTIKIRQLIEDLGNSSFIHYNSLIGLCYVYKINIILTTGKCMKPYIFNSEEDTFFTIDIDLKHLYIKKTTHEQMKKTHIPVVNLEKPLKSITSYKLQDLKDIASLLDISLLNNKKKKTKKILYQEIKESFIKLKQTI